MWKRMHIMEAEQDSVKISVLLCVYFIEMPIASTMGVTESVRRISFGAGIANHMPMIVHQTYLLLKIGSIITRIFQF